MGEVFRREDVDAFRERGDALRNSLNAICAKHGVTMQFTGIGSMLQVHFRSEAIRSPYTLSAREEALRELYFLDLMDAGIYVARRGMVALSLPTGEKDFAKFRDAVSAFCVARGPLLR